MSEVESTFAIDKIRLGHRLNLGADTCYWFEVEHPGEGPNTMVNIFDLYLNQYQWTKFIRPGSTVVDIGGHSGDTTVPMQYLARGTVLVAEPNPVIRPALEVTCAVNAHLGRFAVAHEAVTTVDTESVTILDHNNALCNGGLIDESWTPELQARMRSMGTQKFSVPGLTLENLCKKYLSDEEIAKIGFIKSDTEGHDISILEASRDFIDRLKPVLFVEWFFAFTEVESQHMFDVIASMGYLPFYPETLEPATIDQRSTDLLLIHKTRVGEYLDNV